MRFLFVVLPVIVKEPVAAANDMAELTFDDLPRFQRPGFKIDGHTTLAAGRWNLLCGVAFATRRYRLGSRLGLIAREQRTQFLDHFGTSVCEGSSSNSHPPPDRKGEQVAHPSPSF